MSRVDGLQFSQTPLYFITGNSGKYFEVRDLLEPVGLNLKHVNIDLQEVQALKAERVIEQKIKEAYASHEYKELSQQGEVAFIVEDVSLYFDAFEKKDGSPGLPGALIKWFMGTIGNVGLYKIITPFENFGATAIACIGYCAGRGESIQYFKGVVEGEIVQPRGANGFGWDAVFQPKRSDKTFGEMEMNEKAMYSMRAMAVKKLMQALTGTAQKTLTL